MRCAVFFYSMEYVIRKQISEDRKQISEIREQKTETREQKAENGNQKADIEAVGGHPLEGE